MKKILENVPPVLGLVCQVLIIADLGIQVYNYFKKPKDNKSW